jgi:predicted dehydrogenase
MIGAGFIVQRGHIPSFQAIPNVEVVAIADINQTRAQQVASEAGIESVYTDYEEMLREESPDIVVVATPNVFHKPMTLAALEAGAHVLCEKPLALTYKDAKAMMDTARAKGLVVTVGTHLRWTTSMRAARAHVEAGFLGEIYAARTIWHRRAGIPGFGSWFTNRDLAGGGALLDIGIHALDRALYLMDYPKPTTVTGSTFAKFGPRARGLGGWGIDKQQPNPNARFDVDDLAWAQIRFDNGAALQLQVAWATHYPEQFFTELYGTEGGAFIGNQDEITLYTDLNGQPVTIQPDLPKGRSNSYSLMIADFVRYLEGDTEAEIISEEQALIAVRIIEGVLRSAESGHEVQLGDE